MENLLSQPTEVIGIVALAVLIVREVFSYLKSRNENGHGQDIFQELKLMNNNHLTCLERAVREGNQELIRTLNDNNRQSVELLARIEGKLDK